VTADLTGIENVGEFFSQHYLDELLLGDLKELRKNWQDSSSKSPPDALRSSAQPFFRALGEAAKLSRPAALYETSHEAQVNIAEALGYTYQPDAILELPDKRAVPLIHRVDKHGEPYLLVVEGRFTDESEASLEVPLAAAQVTKAAERQDLKLPRESLGKLIAEAFALEAPPRWVVVIAGNDMFLAERARWGRGRHLRFDLSEILGRKDSQALAITAALLSKDALAPDDGSPIHDTLDENSHKHAYGVSSDLKFAARKAVELLGNEYVWYERNVAKKAMHGERAAEELTEECLIYLYRLLFLFYAEARAAELQSLPMNSEEYRFGYSLEALRGLEMLPLTTQEAQDGYFFQESLAKLFALVDKGFHPHQEELGFDRGADDRGYDERGFRIAGVHSPLFDPRQTPRLSSVKFRNAVLQQVIQLLSLSKERRRGKSSWGRGRISYAQLGINQLGAVYEGLLSYTGFFAKETLYEVHRARERTVDETQQAFFIPEIELDRYSDEELTFEDENGEPSKRVYPPGQFIFRLAGRNRETSASYYTPEVLTRCLVKYSLQELLDGGMDLEQAREEGFEPKSADEILELTVCEPAMGSGAFLVEAIDQLADAYLERKQQELDETIPPEDYEFEKQRVKSYIAENNCYGVDLNQMAARLGAVSLWLATMHKGQEAPWYEPRLAVGNSLVGARLEVYDASDLETDDDLKKEINKCIMRHGGKPNLEEHVEQILRLAERSAPEAVASVRDVFEEHRRAIAAQKADEEVESDATVRAKEEKERREVLVKTLKKTIKDFSLPRHHRQPPHKVDAAAIVEGKRPSGSIYHFLLPDAGMSPFDKDKAIRELVPDAAATLGAWRKYRSAKYTNAEAARLGRLSDRIDALFRRHVEDRAKVLELCRGPAMVWGRDEPRPPPLGWRTIDQRMGTLAILRQGGSAYHRLKTAMDLWAAQWAWPLGSAEALPSRDDWWTILETELDVDGPVPPPIEEQLELAVGSMPPKSPADANPPPRQAESTLDVARRVARRLRVHHWELEFPEAFACGDGFDLVIGNPPWIKLKWSEQGILSDIDPRVELDGLSASETAKYRSSILGDKWTGLYLEAFETLEGQKAFLNALATYPLLQGLQTNLYKCFITQGWRVGTPTGILGLIHQDGVFDDPRGGRLRDSLYRRLRHAYRFKNEFMLFADIDHQRPYCMTVSASRLRERCDSTTACNLFHPSTIDGSWAHDGSGSVPGIKDDENRFDTRGHRSRLVPISDDELSLFAALFDKPGTRPLEARLPLVHSREVLSVLQKLVKYPATLRDLRSRVDATKMWHERDRQSDGTIRQQVCFPDSASDWVVSGPHFYIGAPFNKTPRENCSHNQDYDIIDLTSLSADYLPRTIYVPGCSPEEYTRRMPRFNGSPVVRHFRHAHRRMLSLTGERSLISCLLPPGPAHVDGVYTLLFDDNAEMVAWNALTYSLPMDFRMRASGTTNLWKATALLLPRPSTDAIRRALIARALRLNCLTNHYTRLWDELWPTVETHSRWTSADDRLTSSPLRDSVWNPSAPLRSAFERRWALIEIDALATLELGLTIDELCTIYRTQFPVLRDYENKTWYDRRGRIVFTKNRGLNDVGLDRQPFELWQEALKSRRALPDDFDRQGFEPLIDEDGKPYFDRRYREADMRAAYNVFSRRFGLEQASRKTAPLANLAEPRRP